MLYAVIMAGGSGTRFWPSSRRSVPKQLLAITSPRTLIQETVDRVQSLIPPERVLIVTNEAQVKPILEQAPKLPPENIIAEPCARNTAACVALAATIVAKRDPSAVIAVMPADHAIKPINDFIRTLKAAADFAQAGPNLVTFGVQPTKPETGYGYIQRGELNSETSGLNVYRVHAFREKPDLDTAVKFLQSGEYYWNSGIFVWQAKTILSEIQEHMPALYKGMEVFSKAIGTPDEARVLREEYNKLQSISVDYGIMEKSKHVFVIDAVFEWDDVGAWNAIERHHSKDENGNVILGDTYFGYNTSNCIIKTDKRIVATVGVDNLVIVDTPEALLICRKDLSQDVKKIVELLEAKKRTDVL